jgi:hypothetical protein
MLARHMAKFILGNPTIVVQNMSAAAASGPPTFSTTSHPRMAPSSV